MKSDSGNRVHAAVSQAWKEREDTRADQLGSSSIQATSKRFLRTWVMQGIHQRKQRRKRPALTSGNPQSSARTVAAWHVTAHTRKNRRFASGGFLNNTKKSMGSPRITPKGDAHRLLVWDH